MHPVFLANESKAIEALNGSIMCSEIRATTRNTNGRRKSFAASSLSHRAIFFFLFPIQLVIIIGLDGIEEVRGLSKNNQIRTSTEPGTELKTGFLQLSKNNRRYSEHQTPEALDSSSRSCSHMNAEAGGYEVAASRSVKLLAAYKKVQEECSAAIYSASCVARLESYSGEDYTQWLKDCSAGKLDDEAPQYLSSLSLCNYTARKVNAQMQRVADDKEIASLYAQAAQNCDKFGTSPGAASWGCIENLRFGCKGRASLTNCFKSCLEHGSYFREGDF